MDHKVIQNEGPVPTNNAPVETKASPRHPAQPVTGVVPPQVKEAIMREMRPSVVEASSGLSVLGEKLIHTVILAPLGWLVLAPLFLKKLSPFFCKRYTITNRRVIIKRGLKGRPVHWVALADIDEVRFDPASYNAFFRSGTLEIISKGEVKLRLPGVREPDSFRLAILNACMAWVSGKASKFSPFISASAKK